MPPWRVIHTFSWLILYPSVHRIGYFIPIFLKFPYCFYCLLPNFQKNQWYVCWVNFFLKPSSLYLNLFDFLPLFSWTVRRRERLGNHMLSLTWGLLSEEVLVGSPMRKGRSAGPSFSASSIYKVFTPPITPELLSVQKTSAKHLLAPNMGHEIT